MVAHFRNVWESLVEREREECEVKVKTLRWVPPSRLTELVKVIKREVKEAGQDWASPVSYWLWRGGGRVAWWWWWWCKTNKYQTRYYDIRIFSTNDILRVLKVPCMHVALLHTTYCSSWMKALCFFWHWKWLLMMWWWWWWWGLYWADWPGKKLLVVRWWWWEVWLADVAELLSSLGDWDWRWWEERRGVTRQGGVQGRPGQGTSTTTEQRRLTTPPWHHILRPSNPSAPFIDWRYFDWLTGADI